ncbi:MAG TPA: site-2 protease family protein [Cyclobacteriaceae bacterium]|nr:site-2 protease family protein [Cyclobacteriaceae bacterium]HMV09613.1 site-2 protease family protein [Cyclobacteriaceae bacterium]HMV90234.1 site-2 protease family protein [Cyclobacteriaceae bacterium]HMX01055.1 site-2 protease family protein [Cyclobacteriaceae bacterium]HMX51774.1 site-2 protease family protein [Cyclobacteriaceae bacterium]
MRSEQKRILIQVLLFITTFFTTTLAGAEWCYGKLFISIFPFAYNPDFTFNDFLLGMQFSVPFLAILTVHEFGHYFTALSHKVKSSLPYYIPFPPLFLSIGTMGAVIRLRSRVPSTRKNFDIGIAGPIAGFIMALAILYYGFATLPPAEHIFTIHPEYKQYGLNYADHVYKPSDSIINVALGKNLLFTFLENTVADPERVPNVHEMMHYPFLFAGFLALVFTSLNLLPIGQLDGGHVLYGFLGFKKHRIVASVFFVAFILYAGLGLEWIKLSQPADVLVISIPVYGLFLYSCFMGLGLPQRDTIMYAAAVFATQYLIMFLFPSVSGYSGWLVFGFIIGRLVGVAHPPTEIEQPLDFKRKILGWIALVIFVVSFTPQPINFP